MVSPNNYYKIIIAATVLFPLITGVLIFLHPAAIFPDPSWGFQVLRGMRMGGGFNMLPNPDFDNIAKNKPTFLSWWSPGQYLVPSAFISLLKLNIGQANAVVATLCSLTGLAGFYACFKKLGFSANVAALSVAFIACQQAFSVPFVFYNGGEVLLFAFAGWFLYGCTYFNKISLATVLFIYLSGVIGFFCKSSFIWIFFSGGFYLWMRLSSGQKVAVWLRNGLFIAIPAVLALATIYLGYLSKGDNPTSDSDGIKLAWETFSFPLAAPLLAGFSIDDLTNGLINHDAPPLFNPLWSVIVLLLLAALSIALVIYICKKLPYKNYTTLLAVFYIIAVLFFGITFLRQANISYESRHLRLIGLLITPGVIYLISKLNAPYRVAFGLVWLFIAYAAFNYLRMGYRHHTYFSARGTTGIAQQFIDQPTLNYLTELDKQEQQAVFVFISADLGLEMKHNRIITFDPVGDNFTTNESIFTYYGHAGPLYITLPRHYMGAKANFYMTKFPGYKTFTLCKENKYYVVYKAL